MQSCGAQNFLQSWALWVGLMPAAAPGTGTLICGCGRQNRVGAGVRLCSAHSPPGLHTLLSVCAPALHSLPRSRLISGSPRGAPARPPRNYTQPRWSPRQPYLILVILKHALLLLIVEKLPTFSPITVPQKTQLLTK